MLARLSAARPPRAMLVLTLLLALPFSVAPAAEPVAKPPAPAPAETPPDPYAGLAFRSLGPAFTSGRVGDIAVDPARPSRYFVAVASGGVTHEQLPFLRHKERKFGRGCIEAWALQQKSMLSQLAEKLMPFEEMLIDKPFLLGTQPHFVDFDLYGMLGNLLFNRHYRLPASHTRLKKWYSRMGRLDFKSLIREKELHS